MDNANHEADTPPAGRLLITYPVNQLLPQDEAIATDPTGTFWQPDVTQHDDDSIDGGSSLQVEEELEDFLKNSTAALKADPEAPDLSRGVSCSDLVLIVSPLDAEELKLLEVEKPLWAVMGRATRSRGRVKGVDLGSTRRMHRGC